MADLGKRLADVVGRLQSTAKRGPNQRHIQSLLFKWQALALSSDVDQAKVAGELEDLLQLLEAAAGKQESDETVTARVHEMISNGPSPSTTEPVASYSSVK
ncbi:hypothetical protein VDF71_05545 [Xanthomonas campestris pv. raphani]|uniref:hypothetical protein n=1 Tax=Xanthomonas campestris TaxID=339 RepID=UPI002B23D3A6|nr:hypothetical protein [Xanthomonas campestris]MEA9770779.1 hypothetical protein [Xanthomonas campestris pv. raphani]MEA9799322.1 hypothetical protein [Xanthomonas campestris pv. raphani]